MACRILVLGGASAAPLEELTWAGFEIDLVPDTASALSSIKEEPVALILLDVALSGTGAFEVCRQLQACGITSPIVIYSSVADVHMKVQGLKAGADDYMTHPVDLPEFMARIHALLRRGRNPASEGKFEYQFGNILVDSVSRSVVRDGRAIKLSAREFQLLRYLIERRGQLVRREELLSAVWGRANTLSRTLDVHIAALRRKVEEFPYRPQFIRTIRGKGYVFCDTPLRP